MKMISFFVFVIVLATIIFKNITSKKRENKNEEENNLD